MSKPKKSNAIQDRAKAIDTWLWSEQPVSRPLQILRQTIQVIFAISRDLRDGQLSLRAMSLVYTTVIAIVPLLAISFSVLKGFGMHNQVEPALLEALVDLGDKRYDIVENVMGFINNVNVGVLGSVGFAILIYSVVSMMQKIETAFNYIWQIGRGRSMSERLRDYLSVIFVGPLLIFLSSAITTSFNTQGVISHFEAIPFGLQLMRLLGDFFPYLLMSAGFALLYMFLPNTRVRFGAAFIGGLVTTLFWKLMGWGVSNFVANSASSMAIYSAFASVIILMMWMYFAWLVLLLGASVTFYVQTPERVKQETGTFLESGQSREELALAILYLVAQAFTQGKTSCNAELIATELNIAQHRVDAMLDELITLGYVVRSDESAENLYPRREPEDILLADVINDICSGKANEHASLQQPPSSITETIANCRNNGTTNLHSIKELLGSTDNAQ